MGPVLKIAWYPSHSQLFDIDGPSAGIILCRKKRLITAFPGHYWEEIEPNLRNPGYNWDQKDPSPHLAAIQFPSFFRNNWGEKASYFFFSGPSSPMGKNWDPDYYRVQYSTRVLDSAYRAIREETSATGLCPTWLHGTLSPDLKLDWVYLVTLCRPGIVWVCILN